MPSRPVNNASSEGNRKSKSTETVEHTGGEAFDTRHMPTTEKSRLEGSPSPSPEGPGRWLGEESPSADDEEDDDNRAFVATDDEEEKD
ncbi:hypothetical protein HDU86_001817 [Geranomyces michiganensis]|nr:hypothetical protein HDU86_001817 [Geranomyces michiganensis]